MSLKRTGIRKPSMRPRTFTEVFLNTHHLEFFKEFLKEQKAEGPLQFLIAVQKISLESSEKVYKSLLENLIKTYFHGNLSPEDILQCDAPIIKDITHMQNVTMSKLFVLQDCVMKSLEEKWFKDYQELFPPRPQEVEIEVQTTHRKPSKTATTYLQELQNRGWLKMIGFVKSFCKYRRFMSNPTRCLEFVDYLHLEMQNNKENFPASPNVSGHPTLLSTNVRSADQENGETILMKRRIFGHRIIIINFVINDIYFFSEMEKFNDLVSSAHVLQVNRAYNENDIILIRSKVNIILKLFLNSDIPPKLRVNISESQKDAILAAITEGHLDQNIFHGAVMSLFPIIMYFWKRFCSWKAIRGYLQYRGKKFKHRKSPPKPAYKYPPCSGASSSNLTQPRLGAIHRAAVSHPGTKITLHQKGEEVIMSGPQQRQIISQRPANVDRTSTDEETDAQRRKLIQPVQTKE